MNFWKGFKQDQIAMEQSTPREIITPVKSPGFRSSFSEMDTNESKER